MQKMKVETYDEFHRYIEHRRVQFSPQFSESTVLTPLRPVYPPARIFWQKTNFEDVPVTIPNQQTRISGATISNNIISVF
jgi:hypothetical protein